MDIGKLKGVYIGQFEKAVITILIPTSRIGQVYYYRDNGVFIITVLCYIYRKIVETRDISLINDIYEWNMHGKRAW